MNHGVELVFNASMVGDQPTGLGVYSLTASRITKIFKSKVISSRPDLFSGRRIISSPKSVGIGSGKLSALRRILWARSLDFGDNTLAYSPTHHGFHKHISQVVTLHDMICLRFPRQHLTQYLYFKIFVPRLIKKCKAVFTVSETTRSDISKTYGYPLDKIYVVPNSVDSSRFFPNRSAKNDLFILMVGAKFGHKNVHEVIINNRFWKRDYKLVVTSCSGKYRRDLDRLICKLGIEDRVEFKDYVSAEELLSLYQGCAALVYPSKWEGFGIPPLEALACGRPVIASDIEIHREVLADSAIYVKLGDQESWREAFSSLRNEALIEEKLAKGMERVLQFSPEAALAKLEECLLQVEPALERT